MKNLFSETSVIVLLVACCVLPVDSFAAQSPMSKTNEKDQSLEVLWLYDSPLTLHETITPINEGQYRYSFSFINTDVNPIWHFAVYTKFDCQQPFTPWLTHNEWSAWWSSLQSILPPYDLRELDPEIIGVANTWSGTTPDLPPAGDVIQPGSFVEGFSFVSNVFDPSEKYYMYETLGSGYAPDSGHLAAVGITQGGFVSEVKSTLGAIKSLYR